MPRNKTSVENTTRERAYAIWESEGYPHGRDLDHWLRAETELTRSKNPKRQAKPAVAKPGSTAGKSKSTRKTAYSR